MSIEDVGSLIEKKFGKRLDVMSDNEKVVYASAMFDCSFGRYSKFLKWSVEKISEFFKYCEEHGIDYKEESVMSRWAIEDSFDMV